MSNTKRFFQIFAVAFASQIALLVILISLVYFVPSLREKAIIMLQRESGTWEPSERVVAAEYFVQTSPDSSVGYTTTGVVYVYECSPQGAQIDIGGVPTWISRSQLKPDVCQSGKP